MLLFCAVVYLVVAVVGVRKKKNVRELTMEILLLVETTTVSIVHRESSVEIGCTAIGPTK